MTDLKEYISRGAIHNPYGWWPGFYFCLVCKGYRMLRAYTLNKEERLFCVECETDQSLYPEKKH